MEFGGPRMDDISPALESLFEGVDLPHMYIKQRESPPTTASAYTPSHNLSPHNISSSSSCSPSSSEVHTSPEAYLSSPKFKTTVEQWGAYLPTTRLYFPLYDQNYQHYEMDIRTKIDKLSNNSTDNYSSMDEAYILYRQNQFELEAEVPSLPSKLYIQIGTAFQPVDGCYFHLYAVKQIKKDDTGIPIVENEEATELIQYLSARERKEVQVPPPAPVVNGQAVFSRLQFKAATLNNGRASPDTPHPNQQYFRLVLSLIVKVEDTFHFVLSKISPRLIVRGRNPGNFQHSPTHEVASTSSSPTDHQNIKQSTKRPKAQEQPHQSLSNQPQKTTHQSKLQPQLQSQTHLQSQPQPQQQTQLTQQQIQQQQQLQQQKFQQQQLQHHQQQLQQQQLQQQQQQLQQQQLQQQQFQQQQQQFQQQFQQQQITQQQQQQPHQLTHQQPLHLQQHVQLQLQHELLKQQELQQYLLSSETDSTHISTHALPQPHQSQSIQLNAPANFTNLTHSASIPMETTNTQSQVDLLKAELEDSLIPQQSRKSQKRAHRLSSHAQPTENFTTDSNGNIYLQGKVGINTAPTEEALTVHGNVLVTGNYLKPSDERVKKNITKVNGRRQLANIENLELYEYDLKHAYDKDGANVHETGVLAQELRKVLPSAVQVLENVTLADGTVMPELLVVNDRSLLYENIGATKELSTEVRANQENIDAINQRSQDLKSATHKAFSALGKSLDFLLTETGDDSRDDIAMSTCYCTLFGLGPAWTVYFLGFFVPPLWLYGVFYISSFQKVKKLAGFFSAVTLILYIGYISVIFSAPRAPLTLITTTLAVAALGLVLLCGPIAVAFGQKKARRRYQKFNKKQEEKAKLKKEMGEANDALEEV